MINDIFTYNFSIQGKGHIKKEIPCQDYSETAFINDKIVIGVIADGIGSAKHSDIASKLAVKSVIKFVKENLPHNVYDKNLMYALMMLAFSIALKNIQLYSKKSGIPMDELDTTLDAVIYDGKTIIIYGHVGDSGVLALNEWGEYIHITKQDKGAESNQTHPLAHVNSWSFGDYRSETINGIIMATDGMLEKVLCFPNINKVQPYDYYIPTLTFFTDPDTFTQNSDFSTKNGQESIKKGIEKFIMAETDYDSNDFYNTYFYAIQKKFPEKNEEDIYEILKTFVKYNMPVTLTQKVTDDKTILAMINVKPEHSEHLSENDYYDINWAKLNNIEFPNKQVPESEPSKKTVSKVKKGESKISDKVDKFIKFVEEKMNHSGNKKDDVSEKDMSEEKISKLNHSDDKDNIVSEEKNPDLNTSDDKDDVVSEEKNSDLNTSDDKDNVIPEEKYTDLNRSDDKDDADISANTENSSENPKAEKYAFNENIDIPIYQTDANNKKDNK